MEGGGEGDEEKERRIEEGDRWELTWLVESGAFWEMNIWTRMWSPEVNRPARMAQVSGSGSML